MLGHTCYPMAPQPPAPLTNHTRLPLTPTAGGLYTTTLWGLPRWAPGNTVLAPAWRTHLQAGAVYHTGAPVCSWRAV